MDTQETLLGIPSGLYTSIVLAGCNAQPDQLLQSENGHSDTDLQHYSLCAHDSTVCCHPTYRLYDKSILHQG